MSHIYSSRLLNSPIFEFDSPPRKKDEDNSFGFKIDQDESNSPSGLLSRHSSFAEVVEKRVPPCRIGLPNAALTCYLNAVFQCLFNTPSFACDLSSTWEQISKSRLQVQEKMFIGSFCQLLKKKQEGKQNEVCDIMQSQIHKNKILRQLSGDSSLENDCNVFRFTNCRIFLQMTCKMHTNLY